MPFFRLSLLFSTLFHLNAAEPRQNILFISIDDLRPELNCYGVDYIHSPNIDQLASKGRIFNHHYVQAPTCGASRYSLLTGRYGSSFGNQALNKRAEAIKKGTKLPTSLPAWFRKQGYTTISVGKVSHHPGGRGGENWNDDSKLEMPLSWDQNLMPSGPWKNPRKAMHGLAKGAFNSRQKPLDVFESFEGPDTSYPDGLILNESLSQLEALAAADKPFFLAVGFIRPHLPFGAPASYYEPYKDAQLPPIPHPNKPAGTTTWHSSGEFFKQYNLRGKNPNKDAEFAIKVRKHYAACVTYADKLVGDLLKKLDSEGLRENTTIVLWGDHGWLLGEHAIWGKHCLFEEALRSPLIISTPKMTAPGTPTDAIVETIDLYPTLCELTGLPTPSDIHGKSLVNILHDPTQKGLPAISYHSKPRTIRDERYRLIIHEDGSQELYDQTSPTFENIASKHPDVVSSLSKQLEQRLKGRDTF